MMMTMAEKTMVIRLTMQQTMAEVTRKMHEPTRALGTLWIRALTQPQRGNDTEASQSACVRHEDGATEVALFTGLIKPDARPGPTRTQPSNWYISSRHTGPKSYRFQYLILELSCKNTASEDVHIFILLITDVKQM